MDSYLTNNKLLKFYKFVFYERKSGMVSEFLKKRLDVHINLLNDYEFILSDLKIERNENLKFIKILNGATDKPLSSFSPFNVSKDDDKKIKELRINLHTIDKNIEKYNILIEDEQSLIDEIKVNIEKAIVLENK